MSYAIVYKIGPKGKPGTGTVRPVLIVGNEEAPRIATVEDFPNNKEILITHNYEQGFGSVSPSQLVKLPFDESDHNLSSVDPGAPHYCKYMADGYDAEPLNPAELPHVHVIAAAFDINRRHIELSYVPDRYIVLLSPSQNKMYGPFDYNEPEPLDNGKYRIELKPYERLPGFEAPNYGILEFSANLFKLFSISGEQKILLTDIKGILEAPYDILDFIPDDKLINLANGLLSNNKLGKSQLSAFKDALAQIPESNPKFDKDRSQRLVGLVERTDYWTTRISNQAQDYLKTPEGQEKVRQYILAYKHEFSDLAKEVAEKEFDKPRQDLQKEIAELKKQKENFQSEVHALEAKKYETSQETEEGQSKDISSRIDELKADSKAVSEELDARKLELETLLKSLDVANSIEELLKEEEKIKWSISRETKTRERLEKLKDDLIKQINQSDDERKQRLMEVAKDEKPYLDILNGIVPTFASEVQTKSKTIQPRKDKPDAKTFVREVQENLKRIYRRSYDFTDIANFLICIDQNFLTVFSGLPGVGKTSLVTCLAGVLGLKSQDCFLNIPTARGFTSQRDILGFYNPLSQRFQASATGLYEALALLNKDADRALYPYWALLDEANLSPMEHYFSAFLGMCDDGVPREVNTGEPGSNGKLTVPASFRFLATINYDNTTEPLSPRMIDRVPIIRIEQTNNEDTDSPSSVLSDQPLLSYRDFHAIFSPADDNGVELTLEEARVLVNVKKALSSSEGSRGIPTIISPRKSQMIKRYCSAASKLMGDSYPLAALDYAVSQHILPLTNGYGDKYRLRLKDLDEAISQLDRSRSMLKRIIEQGDEEQKFYRYFI